jgi:hypothetical protein
VLVSYDDVRLYMFKYVGDMFCTLRAVSVYNIIDLPFIAEGPFENRPSPLGPQNSC